MMLHIAYILILSFLGHFMPGEYKTNQKVFKYNPTNVNFRFYHGDSEQIDYSYPNYIQTAVEESKCAVVQRDAESLSASQSFTVTKSKFRENDRSFKNEINLKTPFYKERRYINGTLKDKSSAPVEFATVFNLTQKTSCITNLNGEYRIEAKIGDSIQIRHLNYKTLDYIITNSIENLTLTEKDFTINEIKVSPNLAFNLFSKSCRKTYHTFNNENTSGANCRVIRKNGNTITQEIDLDLVVVRLKENRFKKGEKILPYKIQERKEINHDRINKDLEITLNLFYPHIHQIYWVKLPHEFNYYKLEDNERIRLFLFNKASFDYKCRIEVSILKKDTLLESFAMIKNDLFTSDRFSQNAYNYHIKTTEHYIQYNYSQGFGQLEKYYQSMTMGNPMDVNNDISIVQYLHAKDMDSLDLEQRPKGRKIFRNSLNPNTVKNRYTDRFWEKYDLTGQFYYNFDQLNHMSFETYPEQVIKE